MTPESPCYWVDDNLCSSCWGLLQKFPNDTPEHRSLRFIFRALNDATVRHPGWMRDPIHGAAVIAEEAGEICSVATDLVYNTLSVEEQEWAWAHMREEIAQTAAVCLRMLMATEDRSAVIQHAIDRNDYEHDKEARS